MSSSLIAKLANLQKLKRKIISRTLRYPNNFLVPEQFKRDNFLFIHIPKCAGSNFLNSYLGFQLGHASASNYFTNDPTFFREAFSCAFVRNPIQRFVSAYNHLNTCDLWPGLTDVATMIRSRSSTLSDLAENIHLYPDLLALGWFVPQCEYIMIDGKVAVTRVFKTENYEEAVQWIAGHRGISLHASDSHINSRSDKGLLYGDQDISQKGLANLKKIYWRDFTLFGYY